MHDQMQRGASEQTALGAMILDNSILDFAIPLLARHRFVSTNHLRIYDSMVAVHKSGNAVDLVTLRDELERRGELDAVGGVEYLADLLDHAPWVGN